MIAFNLVVLYEELFFALHDEDSLALLRVADKVVHDFCHSCILTTKCDTRLNVAIDLVRYDLA